MKKLYCKMGKQFNSVVGIVSICVALGTGCGEPDIQSMNPTVRKLATEIILVDQPANWNTKDLTNMASQAGVDALVVTTDGTHVSKVMDSMVKNRHIGLCVIVSNGPVPADIVSYPVENPETKFEFISDGTNLIQGQNVRNVYINQDWIGYSVGYSTGIIAGQTGLQNIGWVNGNVSLSTEKSQIQSMLAGAYAANPKVSFIPVTIGVPGVPLPHILVTNRTLTSSELVSVSQAGSVVLSLASLQGNQPYLVWPAMVQVTAVTQDISSYVNSGWRPGNESVGQVPCITLNTQAISQSVSQSISTEESLFLSNPRMIQTTLASIPDLVKASWATLLNSGA